ncbi:Fic family protein [Phycicoccus sp. CSK15P-2]|uniref:Fic family protein n=1 Tax=Phycicoccus sp. CSK15P-2 TaxID=2807627 RepID=UPI00194E5C0A|nr:Fic family protein [Phycicoccus sp. CSK15P-2]MBM6404839.1 Fic family protein [Phycicoccus sp. CSK15P-2]
MSRSLRHRAKSPGRYRTTDIYVRDDRDERTVYERPDADSVPTLMDELAADLASLQPTEPMVRGAMAHLNLVMIHPFRDGNGRMAGRCGPSWTSSSRPAGYLPAPRTCCSTRCWG